MERDEMEKLSSALVGCGSIADLHVEGYKHLFTRGLKVFEIKAVCDALEENARSKAEAISYFQGSKPKTYADLEEMLKNESLDSVDICLPHNLHHTAASLCVEKGLHVIIEKPLGITMRAAKLIIDMVERTGRTLAVAENERRTPRERAFQWVISQRIIGEPRMVLRIGIGFRLKPWGWREDKFIAGGSWVFDGGVHWADIDRYLLGREAVKVSSMTHTFEPVKEGVKVTVDDMTMAIIHYEGEVYSQWLWTRVAPAKRIWMRVIYGSKGALSDDGLEIQREESIVESQNVNTLVNNMRKAVKPDELERFFPKGTTNTFAIELYDFYDSVRNKRKPEVDVWEAYKDMAIPLSFYESATLCKPVKVKDVEELRVEEYQKEINGRLSI